MRRFMFILKNAFIGLARKRLLNGIVVAAVAVGLIFPVYALAEINYMQKNYGVSFYKDIDNTAVVDFNTSASDEEKMKALTMSWSKKIVESGFFATFNVPSEYNGEAFTGNVAGCNAEYFEVSDTVLLAGRMITPEEFEAGAKVCVTVGENDRKAVGTTIKIGGEDFEIVGAVRDIKIYGRAIIPYKAMLPFIEDDYTQYKAYLLCQDEPPMSTIDTAVRKSVDKLEVASATEQMEFVELQHQKGYSQMIIKGAVVLLFSLISFTLIIVGRVQSEQYVLGVKRAVGATRLQLFFDLSLQNFILIQLGAAASMIIYKLIFSLISAEIMGLFDLKVICQTEALCIAMTLAVTAVAFIPILKQPVCNMFKASDK